MTRPAEPTRQIVPRRGLSREEAALYVGKTGEPGHPLYIGYDVQPQLWSAPKLRPDGSPDCGR